MVYLTLGAVIACARRVVWTLLQYQDASVGDRDMKQLKNIAMYGQ